MSEASLCVHRCDKCGVNLGASKLYRDGKLDVSRSHVRSSAPFGLVARGIELRITAVAMRRCWLSVMCELSRQALILRAPNRPCAISQSLSTMASNRKSVAGAPKRRQHLMDSVILHSRNGKFEFDLLYNIVAELVEKQRRDVRSQVLSDKGDLFRSLHTFNDLLRSPGPVFVNTNHSEMRADAIEHRKSRSSRALFEELLNNLGERNMSAR